MVRPQARARNCADVAVLDHMTWAAMIASTVARRHGLRGQEREDITSTAQLTLCELLNKQVEDGGFDSSRVPAGGDITGAFRGWAYLTIRCTCVRAAQAMRGAGLFKSIRPDKLFSAANLGDAAGTLSTTDTQPDDIRQVEEPPRPRTAHSTVPYGRRLAALYGCPQTGGAT